MTHSDVHSNGANPGTPSSTRLAGSRGVLRWWCAVLGLLSSAADTFALKWLGTSFTFHGRDVTPLTAAWFGLTFAILGYLLGDSIDRRRREREAANLIRLQMETINDSRAKLIQSEKLAALGQLAAAIAHEVRNPLAVIRSAAQNLRDTMVDDNAEARRACTFITEETDRLGNLISALLTFARPAHITPVEVPINELFERALSAVGEEISSKHARVRRPSGGELGIVSVDADLMTQVFVGLLANAIDAIPSGGEVSLEVHPNGRDVELTVADSGPGVPRELRSRVFEPFFTTRAAGVGLGLAIARQIVEAHAGSISVGESALGGARFVVTLPPARELAAVTQ